MKKYFSLYIISLLLVQQASAQILTTLNVQSSPTAVLSEWALQNSIVNFIVDKADPNNQTVIFKTEIKLLDGTVVGVTDVTRATPIVLSRGTRVYFSKDVMPLEVMNFTGKYRSSLDKTGKLPADQYQFCVQIVAPGNFQPLVAEKCRNFRVAALQLPILVMPAHNSSLPALTAQTAITFRWTPLTPVGQIIPTYRIQVFEVMSHQQPVQALRSNQPLLDVSVKGITQYIWQPRLAFNTTDSIPVKFIWTIQTLDANGIPAVQSDGNGESRTEPFVFSVLQPDHLKINKADKKL